MLALKAHAKINLTLEVLSRRYDGYHEIVSVLQTVALHDLIELRPANDVSLECDGADLSSSDNLALEAALRLKEKSGVSEGVRIALKKRIPVSAGLGGGSSDAATVLRGLNQLWGLRLSREDLLPMAASLGSDVPFFLYEGTALAQGRGERIRPLPSANVEWIVLLKPPIDVPSKTAALYSSLTPANFTKGLLTHKLAGRIRGGGDVPPQFLFNVFDDVAFRAYPGLEEYWNLFNSLGAREIHLAGSGPTLFSVMPSRQAGTAVQLLLQHRHGLESYLTSCWYPSEDES